jgi:hypothetical protein
MATDQGRNKWCRECTIKHALTFIAYGDVLIFNWYTRDRVHNKLNTKLHGVSPRANYSDRATAACRRSDCQLLRIEGCHVVSVTHPYGRILGFLDRSRYFFFQVALQLYSRGWVDSVPDPLLLRKSGSTGNRTRTFGSVTRKSDH